MNKKGLEQASGIVGYIALFALFIANAEHMMPKIKPPLGPLMLLSLFCFSVLVCGLIVFYQPYQLFLDKKPKGAMKLVVSTTKWLGVYVVVVMIAAVIMFK